MKKARLVSSMPITILAGVDGSSPRLFSQPQTRTRGSESTTIQNGLIELEMTPETFQSVFSSAQ